MLQKPNRSKQLSRRTRSGSKRRREPVSCRGPLTCAPRPRIRSSPPSGGCAPGTRAAEPSRSRCRRRRRPSREATRPSRPGGSYSSRARSRVLTWPFGDGVHVATTKRCRAVRGTGGARFSWHHHHPSHSDSRTPTTNPQRAGAPAAPCCSVAAATRVAPTGPARP